MLVKLKSIDCWFENWRVENPIVGPKMTFGATKGGKIRFHINFNWAYQKTEWIICVSLAMCTCYVLHSVLSHFCQRIICHSFQYKTRHMYMYRKMQRARSVWSQHVSKTHQKNSHSLCLVYCTLHFFTICTCSFLHAVFIVTTYFLLLPIYQNYFFYYTNWITFFVMQREIISVYEENVSVLCANDTHRTIPYLYNLPSALTP